MNKELSLGIIASLVASFVWWFLSQMYSFDSRKRIAHQIILLRNDNYSFQKFLDYCDYDLALAQAQRMLEEIGEIHSLIKPLTYIMPKKKKLINTLLNNLYISISRFQRFYKGYDNDSEKEACCQKMLRELYIWDKDTDRTHFHPSISDIAIRLLSHLNYEKWSTVKSSIKKSIAPENLSVSERESYQFLKDIIDVNSFANSVSGPVSSQYDITNKIMTQEEYYKLIDTL